MPWCGSSVRGGSGFDSFALLFFRRAGFRAVAVVAATPLCAAKDGAHPADPVIEEANAALVKGEPQQALAILDKAIRQNPKAIYHARRGAVLVRTGDFDKARAEFDKAIRSDPQLPEPYLNRGNLAALRGELGIALVDLSKALELDPRLAEGYANRGSILRRTGQLDLALADFR